MPIKVTNKSPHAEAAQNLTAEDVKTTETVKTTGGQEATPPEIAQEHTPVPVSALYERIEVGTSFKMPVAEYTMLEFRITRSMPCEPEKVEETFDACREWVEGKLNLLIEEQSEN